MSARERQCRRDAVVRAARAQAEVTVVLSDERVDDGEAEAGSWAAAGVVAATEALDRDRQEVRLDARTGVGHREDHSCVGAINEDVDWWLAMRAGVGDEIGDDLSDSRSRHRDAAVRIV